MGLTNRDRDVLERARQAETFARHLDAIETKLLEKVERAVGSYSRTDVEEREHATAAKYWAEAYAAIRKARRV